MKTHIKKSIVSTVIIALALSTPALASLPIAELGKDDAKAAIDKPSTIKITSNAHAADAGNGILFNWDTKQKDNTVITVTAADDVTTSFSIIVKSSAKYFIGQVEMVGSGTVTIDKPSKNINMVYITGLPPPSDDDTGSGDGSSRPIVDPGVPTPPGGLTEAVVRYYAICQLWNDLMWGADGHGLSSDYDNALGEQEKLKMLPVGIDHRTALQQWWNDNMGTDYVVGSEQDVRYIPVAAIGADFADDWADIILYDDQYGFSLQHACDEIGIDVEDFIRNYDVEGFLTRNELW